MARTPSDADLLTAAIRLASGEGTATAEEVEATLSEALADPGFEARLRALLEAEGISAEYQRVYLEIFDEWRRTRAAQRRSSS